MKATIRFAVLSLTIYSAPALGDVPAQVAACRSEADTLKRLVCYDAIPVDAGAAETAAAAEVVAVYEAGGTTTTRPFTVSEPFVVRVEETDSQAMIQVMSANAGHAFPEAILSVDPNRTPAEVYVAKPGKYVLDVMAFGYWRAEIIRAE